MRYVLIPSHTAGPHAWQILDKLDAYTVVWRGTNT